MVDSKFIAMVHREDIFTVEHDRRILYVILSALIAGILLGSWLQTMTLVQIAAGFFIDDAPEIKCNVSYDRLKYDDKSPEKTVKDTRKVLRTPKDFAYASNSSSPSSNRGGRGGRGNGDIRQRVNEQGLIAILRGKATSGNGVSMPAMPSSFTKDLDIVLRNISGLKTSGRAAIGRKGPTGAEFNSGYYGEGGPSGNIDALISGLTGTVGRVPGLSITPAVVERTGSSTFWKTQESLSGRSPQDIYAVVMQHVAGLRHEYAKRLRDQPGLKGKITVKFSIAKSGSVLLCRMVESTLRDPVFEKVVVEKIRTWKFDACGDCGIAMVTFPFAFSQ
jgi:hypothetical protein